MLIVGAERSGKSFFANKLARMVSRASWSLVYNVVRPGDFAEASDVTFLDVDDHKSLLNSKQKRAFNSSPSLQFFARNYREVFKLADWNRVAWGRMWKCQKLDYREEEYLWQAFFDYMACGLVILDDCRETFRHGLQKKMIQLLARKNHAGNMCSDPRLHGYGIDMGLIFHSVDKVNQEIYDYINRMVLFRTNRKPDSTKFDNEFLYAAIEWAYDELNNSPDYHSCHINLRAHNGKVTVDHFDENLSFVNNKTF